MGVAAAGGRGEGDGPAAVSGRYLQVREREEIAVGLAQGLSCRQIAGRLAPGRSASTVCREVRRNSVRGVYRAHLAQREAQERARRPKPAKLAVSGELREWVQRKLGKNWSPEQVSARLTAEFPGRAEHPAGKTASPLPHIPHRCSPRRYPGPRPAWCRPTSGWSIEKKLAARHLARDGLALFDLSSAWLEGRSCPLGAFGHSRDGKKNREQIEFGMVTSRAGIPVAIRAFPGNTSNSVAFGEIIPVVRGKFGLDEVILVGDRGSVTKVRISQLEALPGAGWITALRAPAIAALARDDGPLQMSLFDDQNFAEISDARYPGERLICCRNPALAAQRAGKRESLLAATEEELGKIRASVQAGRLNDAGKIGIKAGKVINKRKVGKHFITDIGDGRFGWRRDEEKIAAAAALDGIYVIRTSATADQLGSGETVEAYKDLGNLERDFWSMKAEDIDLRPIYHYLENRVRAHVFLCMLATYLISGTCVRH